MTHKLPLVEKRKNRWRKITNGINLSSWIYPIIIFGILIVYGIQTINFAHHYPAILDEGTYLYKGYLFIKGLYTPYQNYGVWTNKAPLAFLIQGIGQVVFTPGLRSGRYVAIGIGFCFLAGLWLAAKRLGGRWWAVCALWLVALNPWLVGTYSMAVSQGLTACILVWSLALIIGKDRKQWEIMLSGALAGVLVMTRENMAPVLPLLMIYLIWQFGWKKGLIGCLVGLLVFGFVHLYYWPNILRIWATWIPTKLVPFLITWRPPSGGTTGFSQTVIQPQDRVMAALEGIRTNFIYLLGPLGAWCLVPRLKRWKQHPNFKVFIILSFLFSILVIMHAWASLGKNYCVYCFSGYLAFFNVIGILLIIASSSTWQMKPSWIKRIFLIVGMTCFVLSAAYGSYPETGLPLMKLLVPFKLTSTGEWGWVAIWGIINNKLGVSYETLKVVFPLAAGVLLLLISFLAGGVVFKRSKTSAVFGGFIFLLIYSAILTPTLLFAGTPRGCTTDMIASNEDAGNYLKNTLPEDSLIYYQDREGPIALLYLPGTRIFPPQMNNGYSFKTSGDPDTLARYGLWNLILANNWLARADVALINNLDMQDWTLSGLKSNGFIEIEPAPATGSCNGESFLRIFIK